MLILVRKKLSPIYSHFNVMPTQTNNCRTLIRWAVHFEDYGTQSESPSSTLIDHERKAFSQLTLNSLPQCPWAESHGDTLSFKRHQCLASPRFWARTQHSENVVLGSWHLIHSRIIFPPTARMGVLIITSLCSVINSALPNSKPLCITGV